MAISTDVQYADIDKLLLDPQNPRIGRHIREQNLPQDKLLKIMQKWTIEELAASYLENGGFWTHEALLVVGEDVYDEGTEQLVVVEGNRRLAALKTLKAAFEGSPANKKFRILCESHEANEELFRKVPYLSAEAREDVQSFLGFRHVTGIKQWDADEKAAFIAKLIESEGLTYDEVRKKIGSKTPTVRNLYIAFRVLIQIEDWVEDFDPKYADNRFTILYMAIQTEGVKNYLNLDTMMSPSEAVEPISKEFVEQLSNFTRWLFGNDGNRPLITDTRMVSEFGRILLNEEAVDYLLRTPSPSFSVASNMAGCDKEEIITLIKQSADNIQLALGRAHHFRSEKSVRKEVEKFGRDALQLLNVFPAIHRKLLKEEEEAE